jgi:glycosyltransferase involved in cell wall biosynthesis
MKPLISFVIPCFNQAQYLKEALDSLRRQGVPDWEAIVVDDGSTTGDAAAVVKEVADPRVRLIRNPENRGLAASRNTAVRAAQTELLMPLDADDRLAPEFVARHLDAFADPAVGFVYCDVRLFGAVDGVWRYGPFEPADVGRRQPLCGCSAFRLQAWKDVGGYCENRDLPMGNEDWDFWMGVIAKGYRGKHLPLALYEYRQVPGSMARRLRPESWRTHEFYFQRHREFLERHQVADAFLRIGYEESVGGLIDARRYGPAVPLAVRARELGSQHAFVRRLARLRAVPGWAVFPCAELLFAPRRLRQAVGQWKVRTRLKRLLLGGRAARNTIKRENPCTPVPARSRW